MTVRLMLADVRTVAPGLSQPPTSRRRTAGRPHMATGMGLAIHSSGGAIMTRSRCWTMCM